MSDHTGGLQPSYTYAATVVRWVDGDTVDLDVDLGFHTRIKDRFRLYGIDTPERGENGYREAAAFVQQCAPAGSEVIVRTYREQEKYGRWLCLILADGMVLNDMVVEDHLADPYFGGTKK